ncbi:MAG: hypothetical protein ABGX16_17745, partial [Pirellulales bacterium]
SISFSFNIQGGRMHQVDVSSWSAGSQPKNSADQTADEISGLAPGFYRVTGRQRVSADFYNPN